MTSTNPTTTHPVWCSLEHSDAFDTHDHLDGRTFIPATGSGRPPS